MMSERLSWLSLICHRYPRIALGLCTLFTLALGGGLMALMFHSAHKGYDDRIKVDLSPDE